MWCMLAESSKPSSSPPPNIPWHHGGIQDVKACVSVTCIVWSTLPFSWSILLWTISHWRRTLRIRTSQVAEGRGIQQRHLPERCWPQVLVIILASWILDTHFIRCGWYYPGSNGLTLRKTCWLRNNPISRTGPLGQSLVGKTILGKFVTTATKFPRKATKCWLSHNYL